MAAALPPDCFAELWSSLSQTVARLCEGRDPSHGHEHMSRVAANALAILHADYGFCPDHALLYRRTIVAAWLHDVADHKYDTNGTLQRDLSAALTGLLGGDEREQRTIETIIDRVSYSKEERVRRQTGQPVDWLAVFDGDAVAALARHVVSDADKLEAIGAAGIERCREYTQCAYLRDHPDQTSMPPADLYADIVKHADEKLLRLKDEFMHTNQGKKLAEPLHLEMQLELEKLAQFTH